MVVYEPTGSRRRAHHPPDRRRGRDEGWELQGDNNDFVDSFTPDDDERASGVARVHVPKVAIVSELITSPFVWGGLIALALALLVWPRADDEPDEDVLDPDPVAVGDPT